jgi:F-type H+-transporting ATPase subunit b
VIKLPPDITFVIQLVSFLIFWQLMRVIVFLPMQRALKARAEGTSGARERAEALTAEAAQLETSIEAGLDEARRTGAREADEIRRRAEVEEQAIVTRYRDEAAALLERERTATEAQIAAVRAPLQAEATRLADDVVRRMLGRAA